MSLHTQLQFFFDVLRILADFGSFESKHLSCQLQNRQIGSETGASTAHQRPRVLRVEEGWVDDIGAHTKTLIHLQTSVYASNCFNSTQFIHSHILCSVRRVGRVVYATQIRFALARQAATSVAAPTHLSSNKQPSTVVQFRSHMPPIRVFVFFCTSVKNE